MSKMGNLRIEAEEQVEYFSKADFVKVFGNGSDEIWDQHHGSDDPEDYKMEEVKSEGVRTSFFKIGESKVELLEAINPESTISKFIDKRGEGMFKTS